MHMLPCASMNDKKKKRKEKKMVSGQTSSIPEHRRELVTTRKEPDLDFGDVTFVLGVTGAFSLKADKLSG